MLTFISWVFYRIATRKGRKAERQRKKANGEYVSPIEGIFSLLLVIILLPFHLLFGRSKKPKPESAAERYLRESKEYYAKDLARYQANKAMRENMLDEARRPEEQAMKENKNIQLLGQLEQRTGKVYMGTEVDYKTYTYQRKAQSA